MPIQMFNWISRPQAGFHVAAAATGVILLAMTLLMNGLAIYIRYRIRRSSNERCSEAYHGARPNRCEQRSPT